MSRMSFWGILLLAAIGGSAGARDDSFSGTWILDASRPQPAKTPNQFKMKIKQKGSRVSIESAFSEPADGVVPLLYLGIMAKRLTLRTDGEQQKTMVGPFAMQTKTVVQGDQMLTDWAASASGTPVQGHWTHTLKDPNVLIIEIQESTAGSEAAEATLYFVRK